MPAAPRRQLTKDAIVRTALAIVDHDGPDKLSTNAIAAELGVKGPSLYNHVANMAEVIEGIRELIMAEIDLSAIDLSPWTVACEQLARSYRAVFAAHPRVVPLMASRSVQSPPVLASYDAIYVALREQGWPADDVVNVVRAVEYIVIGSALDHYTAPDHDSEKVFDFTIAALIEGMDQRLSRHKDAQATRQPRHHS